jgi:hypothetical protein
MGRYAARTAAGFDFVEDMLVGDLTGAAAARLADALGAKARSAAIDVTDAKGLVRMLSDADVVLNTVGPFFRLGPPVLRAAIQARCYLDINDDWESTEAMLAMADDARGAGVTAVIGMGASPGISNLLAVTAARELDSGEELWAGFDLDAAMPETRGAKPSGGHAALNPVQVSAGDHAAVLDPAQRAGRVVARAAVRVHGALLGTRRAPSLPRPAAELGGRAAAYRSEARRRLTAHTHLFVIGDRPC